MVNSQRELDAVFGALSSPVRREVVEQLTGGGATVGELARPLTISLPSLSRHLGVLEQAGLLTRTRHGRTIRCELVPGVLSDAEQWLARHRTLWAGGLDRLTTYLEENP